MRIIKNFIIGLFFIALHSACFGEIQNHVLIFVSFSMPKESLKGWMADAEKTHASLVIRGLVDNSFKATIQKMTELIKDNHGGVQLDPDLFKRFQINEVPAVVVTTQVHCLPNQTCPDEYDVIYGDVHFDYALEKIARQNDSVSSVAQKALSVLRESEHA